MMVDDSNASQPTDETAEKTEQNEPKTPKGPVQRGSTFNGRGVQKNG